MTNDQAVRLEKLRALERRGLVVQSGWRWDACQSFGTSFDRIIVDDPAPQAPQG